MIVSFSFGKSLWLTCLLLTCCCGQATYRAKVEPMTPGTIDPTPIPSFEAQSYVPDQFGQPLGDLLKTYVNEERLSVLDYEISKSKRLAKNSSQKGTTEIEYTVLRRNGRIIAKFDSELDRLAKVRFGLFSFLGRNEKQLVVEQTSDKFWRYWLVNLQPDFRIIYDKRAA